MILEGKVLVVEDDPSQREMLAGFLREMGLEISEAGDGETALSLLEGESVDLVLTDLRLPGMDGQELLVAVKELNPEIRVVILTAYGTVNGAVESLRSGASDYLLKPLELTEVEHVVRRSLEERNLQRENRTLRRRLGEIESVPGIVTTGGVMARVLSEVARVAPSNVSVLIEGESGTGKELVARAICSASGRSDLPFVAVNIAALSPTLLESEMFGHEAGAYTGAQRARAGRFEAASGGTLFLDEIGDLPPELQVKLLRVLQEHTIERVGANRPIPIDVRVISATHHDLLALVKEGRFREDLYYRLAVVSIQIPPLRSRRADIPSLVEHFLAKHAGTAGSERKGITREAMDRLLRYDYPGNVRELENIIQRGLVLGRSDLITIADLPGAVSGTAAAGAAGESRPEASLPERVAALERMAIEEALAVEGSNQTRAAARLGISERTLRYKLNRLRKGKTDKD